MNGTLHWPAAVDCSQTLVIFEDFALTEAQEVRRFSPQVESQQICAHVYSQEYSEDHELVSEDMEFVVWADKQGWN